MQIRVAKPTERRAVAAFCRKEDPGDYVLAWMDRFWAAGNFYLLMDGAKVAGVVHGRLAPDGSAWISVERVGSDYRGRGWINRMNEFAFHSPPLRRAQAARMLITHDNTSSIRAATKGGFRPVSTLSFLEWEPSSRKKRHAPSASGFVRSSPSHFLHRARGSRLLRQQRGLAYMSFHGAFAVNKRSARASNAWLFDSPHHGPLVAATFPDTGERWMAVQPFASGAAVAEGVIAFAGEQRAESMTVIVPALGSVRKPFLDAGFAVSGWAKRVSIFEKSLARGSTSSRVGAGRKTPRP